MIILAMSMMNHAYAPDDLIRRIKKERVRQKSFWDTCLDRATTGLSHLHEKNPLWSKESMKRLDDELQRAGMEDDALRFKCRQWIGSGVCLLVMVVLPGRLMGDASITWIIQGIGCICCGMAYQLPKDELIKALSDKRDKVVVELPRFVRTIRFSPDHKPLVLIVKDYLKVARSGLSFDLSILLADLEMGMPEGIALKRMAYRIGVYEVRELCMALGILEGGGRNEAKLVLLLIENKLVEQSKRIMQKEMDKRPSRMEWVNEILMVLLGMLFVVPVLLSVWKSFSHMLR